MRQIEIDWPEQGSGGQTVVHDTMNRDEVTAYHFHTPEELGTKKGLINLVEFDGQPSDRTGCLSLTAGAIDSPVPGEGAEFRGTRSVTMYIYGSEQEGRPGKTKDVIVLQPDTDYFLNVVLENPPDSGKFGTQVTLQKPRS
jgi:hypothetical protein